MTSHSFGVVGGRGLAVLLATLVACSSSDEAPTEATSSTTSAITGQDGDLTVSTANTVLNQYAVLATNVAAGANQLTVTAIADLTSPTFGPLAANDLIMIYQAQGATIATTNNTGYGVIDQLGTAGRYELATVASVSGNTITVTVADCGGFRSAYTTGGRTQVVRVPQLANLIITGAGSITGAPWNGVRGGVVAISVGGTATIDGAGIEASALGFRGGAADNGASPNGITDWRTTDAAEGGEKGESIAGDATVYDTLNGRYGRGAPANGGGGGNAHNAGGGGGANGNNGNAYTGHGVMDGSVTGASAWQLDAAYAANGNALTTSSGGGRGGYTFSGSDQNALNVPPGDTDWAGDSRRSVGGRGGRPLDNDPAQRLFFGGGGGAGDGNNNAAGAGGRGGGLVFLVANSVTGSGSIRANGENGGLSNGNPGDAPGGAGAGGTIVVRANSLAGVSAVANGGTGGLQTLAAANEAEGPGGGGGGGYIATSGGTITRTAAGGAGGTTNRAVLAEFPSNGATRGSPGNAGATTAGLRACIADLSLTMTDAPDPVTSGGNVVYTLTATNSGANTATGITIVDTLPAGATFVSASGAGWTCNAVGQVVTCTTSSLANGTSSSVQITANVTAASGTITNTATISATTGDTSTANNTDSETTTVAAAAVNDPPVNAVPGPQTVAEDTTLVFSNTVGVSDPDAGNAQLEVTLTVTNGVLTLTDTTGLTFSVGDGTSDATMTFRGTQAELDAALATLRFDPAPNYNGPALLTITTNDLGNTGSGGPQSDTDTVAITVTPVNDAPTANNDTATVAEDANATAIPVLANDTTAPDSGETLTITSVTQPGNGAGVVTITGGGTGLAFDPAPNFSGTATFTYTVSDGNGGTATATVTVTVTPSNDAPNAVNDTATVAEDSGATAIPVLANDVDPDAGATITITSVTQPANGTVVITGGGSGLTFQPAPGFSGTATFSYTITDNTGLTDTATVTVTVTAENDPVIAVDDTRTVAEDSGATAIPVLANDINPDPGETTRIQSVTQPANGTVIVTGGGTGLTFQPAANFNGTTTFTYTITDGNGNTDTATVTVTVTPVNDAPNAVNDTANVPRNSGATAIPVLANDTIAPDAGETLTITSVTQPANGTVVITGGGTGLTFQPAPGFLGTATFTYSISDGNGGTDTATVTITVTGNNNNPDAVNDAATVAEDSGATAIPVLANDTTDPGETLTITGVTQPANGTVIITGGGTGVTFQPAANFTGTTTFTYTVSDGNGGTDTATVTVNVTPVNDNPNASNDNFDVPADAAATALNVLLNDTIAPDTGETLTITAVTQPANGTVTIIGGGSEVAFQPAPGFIGTVTFTYTVSDGNGGMDTATVTVNVTGTDSDGDGLTDTRENQIGTDPQDADSDDDGVIDGQEPEVGTDTDGDGLVNGLDPDSDNDGLYDGTELGVTTPHPDTDVGNGHFVPDSQPSTRTDPLDPDTDDGGAEDGDEDTDGDGRVDTGERDPTAGNGADDPGLIDTDGDGLPDQVEVVIGTDPQDADSDDDGVIDGDEPNYRDDTDGDGLINPLDPDSDNDGLYDGTESGVTQPHPDTDVGAGHFTPDADPATTTSPLDPDTDNGGVPDGAEDTDGDGRVDTGERDPNDPADDAGLPDSDNDGIPDQVEVVIGSDPQDADSDDDGTIDGEEANYRDDTDGDGLVNVLDPDSDNDGLFDGTESGVTTPHPDTDPAAGHFTPDADPSTTTSPVDPDTDNGGVSDGAEDTDRDGEVDPGERDPLDPADDQSVVDSDGDGLPDDVETDLGTDPQDADSDDDGIVDGDEPNWSDDTDGDGLINPLDPDSDNDGIKDGTESGVTMPHPDTDVSTGNFTPDADPSTTTSPLDPDTDNGGVNDGDEDTDHDGQVDPGERDPNDPSDDQNTVVPPDRDTDGIADGSDNCPDVANPDQTDEDNDGQGQACDADDDGDGFDDDVGVAGGGCSTSAGGSSGALLIAIVIGGVLRRRRRAAVAAAIVASVPSIAAAQVADEPRDFTVERFGLSSDRNGLLNVESAESRGDLAFDVALWVGYSNDPLTVYTVMDGERERTGSLVQNRTSGALAASLSPSRWLSLGFELPLVLAQDRDANMAIAPMGVESLSSFGVGELRLIPKLTLIRHGRHRSGLSFALIPSFTVPTQSDEAAYLGDGATGFAPHAALSVKGVGWRFALNAGYRFRKRHTLLNLEVDNEIFGSAGVGYRFGDDGRAPIGIDLTIAAAVNPGESNPGFANFNQNYVEGMAGLQIGIARTAIFFVAAGIGMSEGFGTPDWRTLAGLRLGTPDSEKKIREVVKQIADTDGDGLLDDVDQCKTEPEDKDSFEDENGCPDPDNDKDTVLDTADACVNEPGIVALKGCPSKDSDNDGLADHEDKCPTDAEDIDSFEDTDGCPELDNDKDTVVDASDRCPLEPGVVENEGCPDPDRDGDTVVDRLDNCPDEKGDPANQGCVKKQLVKITDTNIEILEAVYFQLNKATILPRSFNLLNNVAAVLKVHDTIDVEVQGHTDSQGNDAYNKSLSQKRANAVRAYLIKKGVAAGRLTAVGYGEEQPVAENDTPTGRAQNRRVVFKIVGGGANVQTKEQGAGEDTMEKPAPKP